MKHVLMVLGGIFGGVVCGLTGAYVLRHYPGGIGLAVGVGLILLGLAFVVPVQLKSGSMTFKDSVIVVVTQAKNALAGGRRSDDPPAAPPT